MGAACACAQACAQACASTPHANCALCAACRAEARNTKARFLAALVGGMGHHFCHLRLVCCRNSRRHIPSHADVICACSRRAQAQPSGARMKRARTGRPRIEERHLTNEARKPWLKLEMSKRTWYRRQAEKRQGRE